MRFSTKVVVITLLSIFIQSLIVVTTVINYQISQSPRMASMDSVFTQLMYNERGQIDWKYKDEFDKQVTKWGIQMLYTLQALLEQQGELSNSLRPDLYLLNNTESEYIRLFYPEQYEYSMRMDYLYTFIQPLFTEIDEVVLYCSNSVILRYSQQPASEFRNQQLQQISLLCQDSLNNCTQIFQNTQSESEVTQDYTSDTVSLSILQGMCKIEVNIPANRMFGNVMSVIQQYSDVPGFIQFYIQIDDLIYAIQSDKLTPYNQLYQVPVQQEQCSFNNRKAYQIDGKCMISFTEMHFHNPYLPCEHNTKYHTAWIVYIVDTSFYPDITNLVTYQEFFNTFILASLIFFIVIFLYIALIAVKMGRTIDKPLKKLSKLLSVHPRTHITRTYKLANFQYICSCLELTKLVIGIIEVLNTIKYYDYFTDDEGLLMLCNAKLRFRYQQNSKAVGICANNISLIHLKNHRYTEAMNSQQEAIIIASQELDNLKYSKKIKDKIILSRDRTSTIKLFQKLRQNMLHRFSTPARLELEEQQPLSCRQQTNLITQLGKRNFDGGGIIEDIPLIPNTSKTNGGQSLFHGRLNFAASSYRYEKSILKQTLIIRQFQLGRIMFKSNNVLFQNECINQLISLQNVIEKCKVKSKLLINILFKVYIMLMYSYIKVGRLDEVIRLQNYADQLVLSQSIIVMEAHLSMGESISQTPLQIMIQQLDILRCYYLIHSGNFIEGMVKLVRLIENITIYDPIYLGYAFKQLYKVFQQFYLNKSLIQQLQLGFTVKISNIIIMVEYSRFISKGQLQLAHSLIGKMFSILHDQTVVSMVAFNDTIFEVIAQQELGVYREVHKRCLKQLLIKPGGICNIFEAVSQAILKYSVSNETNYICLLSQGTDEYNASKYLIASKKLQIILHRYQTHLLIVNLAQENGKMAFLKLLSQLTDESQYFNDSKSFNAYFTDTSQNRVNKEHYEFL